MKEDTLQNLMILTWKTLRAKFIVTLRPDRRCFKLASLTLTGTGQTGRAGYRGRTNFAKFQCQFHRTHSIERFGCLVAGSWSPSMRHRLEPVRVLSRLDKSATKSELFCKIGQACPGMEFLINWSQLLIFSVPLDPLGFGVFEMVPSTPALPSQALRACSVLKEYMLTDCGTWSHRPNE
ncbi:hypothetical protein BDN67DRAFT_61333 [Paxillus ammoniavirescens]|nr:hypothetical protein BDN67DRAFT_61333 [Paxillus ammoniavirescens]